MMEAFILFTCGCLSRYSVKGTPGNRQLSKKPIRDPAKTQPFAMGLLAGFADL
jgi:hypothetical protein